MKKVLLIFFLSSITILSCKKDKSTPSSDSQDPEALSTTDVATLDNLEESNTGLSIDSIVLPNGEVLSVYLKEVDSLFHSKWAKKGTSGDEFVNLGPQGARNLLIAKVGAVAAYLANRKNFQKKDEGANKPAQNGLAYSWGGKNHNIRQLPPGHNPVTSCTDEIYGLDCSGFIYQIFSQSGVQLIKGPANLQRKPSVLQEAINKSFNGLDKVKVEDLGSIPTSSFETGDIIYWLNNSGRATHIGFVFKDLSGKLSVYQSNGSVGNNPEDCAKNRGLTRGVRRIKLSHPYWFGTKKKYGITRINADISGQWDFYFKCDQQQNDFMKLNLKFPTTQSNEFVINQRAKDYNGTGIDIELEFGYNKETNVLSCLYHIDFDGSNDERSDKFALKLLRDSTAYFKVDKVLENGGCTSEVRAINRE